MKVLILANNDVGLYRFRKELIQELLLQGNEVTVSLPRGDMVKQLEELGCSYIETEVDRRGVNPVKDAVLFFAYRKIIKELKPDLIVTYTIKPNIYGALAAKLSKTDCYANVTGLGTAFQKKGFLRALVVLMYKMSVNKTKAIFFENEENLNTLVGKRIVRREQACLLNGAGVNLEDFPYCEYPQDNSEIRFLFIGRVMREKGIDELIEAMRQLRKDGEKCSLDVLGSCEEDYLDTLKACEAENWMRYHGHQSDVRPFIKAMHCFVLPSWHEGMANTNLECAAMGRPIITSDTHGCKEAVLENKSGLLCKKQDVQSLYQAMKKMLQLTAQERAEMGIAGRKHMETVFDKRIVVKKTVERLFEKECLRE